MEFGGRLLPKQDCFSLSRLSLMTLIAGRFLFSFFYVRQPISPLLIHEIMYGGKSKLKFQ